MREGERYTNIARLDWSSAGSRVLLCGRGDSPVTAGSSTADRDHIP